MEDLIKKVEEKIRENLDDIRLAKEQSIRERIKISYEKLAKLRTYEECLETLLGIFSQDEENRNKTCVDRLQDVYLILLQYGMEDYECFEIMCYLMKHNISLGILDNAYISVDLSKVSNINAIPLSMRNEIHKMALNNELVEIFNMMKNISHVAEDSKHQQIIQILRDHYTEIIGNEDSLSECHQDVKSHYFDKEDTFNEEDIGVVINAFAKLGFSKEICEKFRKILFNKMSNRKIVTPVVSSKEECTEARENKVSKSEVKTPAVSSKEECKKESENTLSNRDYKKLMKQLSWYINPITSSVNRILIVEEVITCANLMMQLGYSREEIQKCLRKMEKSQKELESEQQRVNIISWYLDNKEKLVFYFDKGENAQHLKNIELYFAEALTCEGECDFWIHSMQGEIELLQSMMSKEEIQNCLRQTEKSQKELESGQQRVNIISWYLDNKEELAFYSDKAEYAEHLKNIELYYTKLLEYDFWIDSMQGEIELLQSMMPKDYEYELTKAWTN